MDRLDIQPAVTAQPPVPRSVSTRRGSRVGAIRTNVKRSWQLYAMLFLPLL